MEHFLHMAMRFLPFWAGSLMLIFGQVAVFFHRRRRKKQWYFWFLSGFFFVLLALWGGFRGDKYSEQWVKNWYRGAHSAIDTVDLP